MLLSLGALGDIEGAPPQSLAVCFEFVSLWAGEKEGQLGRLCAGAIGVYIDASKKLPKYKPPHQKPFDYGYSCLDRLLSEGVTPNDIYAAGSLCLADMAKKIPSEEEVKKNQDT